MTDKPIEWVGAVKKDLMDFPDDARRQAGFELRLPPVRYANDSARRSSLGL
jgi:phage-related protein